jgi:uncharacterized protein (TIGR00251 family)
MKIYETDNGVILNIHVKPKSKKFKIDNNDILTLFCRETPVKGKVNKELIKELSKIFKKEIIILSGFRSIRKRIFVVGTNLVEVEKILSKL